MFIGRRLLLRVGVSRAFDRILSLDGLSDTQRETVEMIRRRHFDDAISEVGERVNRDPHAQTMLAAAAVGDGEHPFLDWLFKDGGWKLVYAVVQAIALAFGVPLPPLPA